MNDGRCTYNPAASWIYGAAYYLAPLKELFDLDEPPCLDIETARHAMLWLRDNGY